MVRKASPDRVSDRSFAEEPSRVLSVDCAEEFFTYYGAKAYGAAAFFELGVLDDVEVGSEEDPAAHFRAGEQHFDEVNVLIVCATTILDT